MIAKIKLGAYVVLAAMAIWFGHKFYSSYEGVVQPAPNPPAVTNAPTPAPTPVAVNPTPDSNNVSTNVVAGSTNISADGTNTLAGTNAASGSNVVQQPTPPPATPTVAPTPPAPTTVDTAGSGIAGAPGGGGRSVKYLGLFVVSLIGLGILIAYDVSQIMGQSAVDYLFNDDGESARDPEYERAEQMWANGKPMDAIELMRDYLKKNPRDQFVALRIAEIYEKDLKNYVAASLEYEEVLKKKLPPYHWGRTAIRLCNVYGRMGKQEQRKELLERIARDYPETPAAKKARKHLGMPDPEDVAESVQEVEPEPEPDGDQGQVFNLDQVIATPDEPAPEPEPEPEPTATPEPPKSNLPPGFRKKK